MPRWAARARANTKVEATTVGNTNHAFDDWAQLKGETSPASLNIRNSQGNDRPAPQLTSLKNCRSANPLGKPFVSPNMSHTGAGEAPHPVSYSWAQALAGP